MNHFKYIHFYSFNWGPQIPLPDCYLGYISTIILSVMLYKSNEININ